MRRRIEPRARAALASEASGQRGHSMSARANALVTLARSGLVGARQRAPRRHPVEWRAATCGGRIGRLAMAGPSGRSVAMLHKKLAAVAAAAVLASALSALPADAAKKQKQYQYRSDTPSLDGRVTGRPRTCGYDMFLYDVPGVPMGPYCH